MPWPTTCSGRRPCGARAAAQSVTSTPASGRARARRPRPARRATSSSVLLGRARGQHHADRQPVVGPVQRQRDRGHPGEVPRRRPGREGLLVLEVARPGRRRRGSRRPAAAGCARVGVSTASYGASARRARAAIRRASPTRGRTPARSTARPRSVEPRVSGRSRCSVPGGTTESAVSTAQQVSNVGHRLRRHRYVDLLDVVAERDQQPGRGLVGRRRTSGCTAASAMTGVDGTARSAAGPARRRRRRGTTSAGGGAQNGSPDAPAGEHVQHRGGVAHGAGQRAGGGQADRVAVHRGAADPATASA